MKPHSNPFLRHAVAPAIWLFAMGMGHAIGPFYFDKNGAAAGSGVVDGGSYTWNNQTTAGQWVDGTNAPVSVAFNLFGSPVDVNFVSGSDAAAKSYTVNTSGGNMYISSLTVNSGNLTIDLANNPNFSFSFGSATMTVNNGASLLIKKGSISTVSLTDRTLSMDVQGTATATVEGFSGGGDPDSALTKNGTGSLFINGASDYLGATTVNGGTLKIQNASAVGFGGAVGINRTQLGLTVTPGAGMTSATLDLNGNATFNKPITLNGTVTGGNTASLINSSAGTTAVLDSGVSRVAFTNAGTGFSLANLTTSPLSLTGGGGTGATAAINALQTTAGTFTINNGGSGWVTGNTLTISGGGATTAAVYTVTASGGVITGLTSTAAGVGFTTLSGLTYTGAKGTAVPTFAGTGATFTANDNTFGVNSIKMLTGGTGYTSAPTLASSAGSGFTAGTSGITSLTLTGTQNQIGGAGNLTINTAIGQSASGAGFTKIDAGTLTLNGANTYSGATTVNGGILNVTGSTASGSAVAIGGASATGTSKLTGSGTINGAVTVKSAGGGVAGTLSAGDATSMSKVGTMTLGSSLTFESGSIFEWDINANKDGDGVGIDTGTAGNDFDKVAVSGALNVDPGAIFKVVLGSGVTITDAFWSTPNTTQTWDIATIFGKNFTSGAFSPTVQTSTDVSTYGSFTVSGTTLTWTAVPEPTSALAGLLVTAGLLRRRRQG